jgi:WD40 repeat protein/serine/threonine protein kinase
MADRVDESWSDGFLPLDVPERADDPAPPPDDDWAPTLRLHPNWPAGAPTEPISSFHFSIPREPAAEPLRVQQIGAYQIRRVLARGGMGVIYQAFDTRLKRAVALKMILSGPHAEPAAFARFRGEAETIAHLQHPNIVQIYEVGEHEGLPFFALEFVDGPSLQQVLAQGPLASQTAAELTRTLAGAIDFAHQRGIVHRDLKPGNILLQVRNAQVEPPNVDTAKEPVRPQPIRPHDLACGIPKITDFGLAKLRGRADAHTRPGEVIGTPNYMAPEQAEGDPTGIGPISDVYALGAVLYEMLTGQPPFSGSSPMETLLWVRLREPVPPSRFQPEVPRDLETICLKCLRKERHRRYASAAALAEDLDRFLHNQPILARPTNMAERLWKGARRHPALATISVLFILFAFLANALLFWKWRDADEARTQAQNRLELLTRMRADSSRTQDELERTMYELRLSSAEREWLTEDTVKALEKLQECPPHLRNWEWHYLHRKFAGNAITVRDQGGESFGLTYLPGENGRLLSLSNDGRLQVRHSQSGQVLDSRPLQLPAGATLATTFARPVFDQSTSRIAAIFTCALPGDSGPLPQAGVWEVKTGRLLHSWTCRTGTPIRVALSADGKQLAWTTGTLDKRNGELMWWEGEVRQFDLETGQTKHLRQMAGHSVVDLSFSPDGRLLALTGRDTPMLLCETVTGKEVASMPPGEHFYHGVVFHPDGQRLVLLGGNEVTICSTTGERRQELRGHRGMVMHAAFSHDHRYIATACNDNLIRVYDLHSHGSPEVFVGHTNSIYQVAFSANDALLASQSADGSLKIWELHTGNEPPALGANVHKDWVPCTLFLPGGDKLLTVCGDKNLRVWDWRTRKLLQTIPCREAPNHAALSPDGKTMAIGYDHGAGIGIWDTTSWTETRQMTGHTESVRCVAFSSDGQWLASASEDASARIWDVATGHQLSTFRGHTGQVLCVQFLPDKSFVVSGGEDGKIHVWDSLTANELSAIQVHSSPIACLALSPNGKWLACGNTDRDRPEAQSRIHILDTSNWAIAQTLNGHIRSIWHVTYSPDGTRLFSAGEDNTVKVWDPLHGQLLLSLKGHADDVRCLAFHPHGNVMVSSSDESFIRIWDATRLR